MVLNWPCAAIFVLPAPARNSLTRAKRRYLELQEKGTVCDLDNIQKDIEERDQRDMNREISPLRQAEDAVLVDSSDMTIDEVVEKEQVESWMANQLAQLEKCGPVALAHIKQLILALENKHADYPHQLLAGLMSATQDCQQATHAFAEKAGVSPAMFTRLKKGSIVTLEAFAQLCASCRLNPIDYMPELQTAQEHETAKERPMEETKRLSIDGKEFTIRDVDIRSGSAWANGPRISDAELPDGQVLGSIMPWHGEWLWRLAGEDWQRTKPAEGPMAAYTGQGPNRLSAIDNLLQAIEDRYSDTNTDPWVFMTDSASTTPDTVGQTTPEPVGDPWSLIPSDDAGLPMPNPGIDPGADITANTGIGI